MKVLGVGVGGAGTTTTTTTSRRKKGGYYPPQRPKRTYHYGRSLPSKPNGSFPALDQDLVSSGTPYEPLGGSSKGMAGSATNSRNGRNWKQQVSKLNCIVCVAGGVGPNPPADPNDAGAAGGSATSREHPEDDGDDFFDTRGGGSSLAAAGRRGANSGKAKASAADYDDDSTTLDHTHDETATSTGNDESHGGIGSPNGPSPRGRRPDVDPSAYYDNNDDPYHLDGVAYDHSWRARAEDVDRQSVGGAGRPRSKNRYAGVGPRYGNDVDDDDYEVIGVGGFGRPVINAMSADSSSHYLSETRTSDSSGLPPDAASFSTTTSESSAEGRAEPTSKRRGASARPLPPRHRRRQRRIERQRRKQAAAAAAAEAGTTRSMPRDPTRAEEEETTNHEDEEVSGRVGIRPFLVPEEVRKRMAQLESQAPPEGLDHEYNYFIPTAESNIEFPAEEDDQQQEQQPEPLNEEESLDMYDEDMYYQRAQEILHAALVASAQSSPERGSTGATTESRQEVEPSRSPNPTEMPSTATTSPKSNTPFQSNHQDAPPVDQDDEEPALDETGGTYDDDDTIATEEAIDHAPTPCPSEELDVASKPVPMSNVNEMHGTAEGSNPADDVMTSPAQRHRLQAMARSPSQGDSPVARTSKMGSPLNVQAATPNEMDSLRPEDLMSSSRDSATPPRSIQETLQKLESLNVQLRADREAFESPSRTKSAGRKSFDRFSPLRAAKSFPEDSVKSLSSEKKLIPEQLPISSRSGDDMENRWDGEDPFEIRKSPSSPPSFSDTETDDRKQRNEKGLPPSIPQLQRPVPSAPPPSPSTNVRKVPSFVPPPPPTPPPPNTPLGTSPANSIPSSPANSAASSKLKTLINKFESTPTRSSTSGPRKMQQKAPVALSSASKGQISTEGSVRKLGQLSVAPTKPAASMPDDSRSNEPISRPPPSLVASTRLKYSSTPASPSLPPPSPRAPANTPESSPKAFGTSVRKVPSSRRGSFGSPTHPSPRSSLVKHHPTWSRFPPNASPPSESSRQPLQAPSRSTPGSMGPSQTLHLTPPVLTQQRHANRPISSSKPLPSPASTFFWRSYPSTSEPEPELTQQESLESLADALTNSTNDDTTTIPGFEDPKGSFDGKHQRLGDYERMLLTKRQEARRKYEEANKPPWAKKGK